MTNFPVMPKREEMVRMLKSWGVSSLDLEEMPWLELKTLYYAERKAHKGGKPQEEPLPGDQSAADGGMKFHVTHSNLYNGYVRTELILIADEKDYDLVNAWAVLIGKVRTDEMDKHISVTVVKPYQDFTVSEHPTRWRSWAVTKAEEIKRILGQRLKVNIPAAEEIVI